MRSLAGGKDPEKCSWSMSSCLFPRTLNLNRRRRCCADGVNISMVRLHAHNSTTCTDEQQSHQQSGQQNLRGPPSSHSHHQLLTPAARFKMINQDPDGVLLAIMDRTLKTRNVRFEFSKPLCGLPLEGMADAEGWFSHFRPVWGPFAPRCYPSPTAHLDW